MKCWPHFYNLLTSELPELASTLPPCAADAPRAMDLDFILAGNLRRGHTTSFNIYIHFFQRNSTVFVPSAHQHEPCDMHHQKRTGLHIDCCSNQNRLHSVGFLCMTESIQDQTSKLPGIRPTGLGLREIIIAYLWVPQYRNSKDFEIGVCRS